LVTAAAEVGRLVFIFEMERRQLSDGLGLGLFFLSKTSLGGGSRFLCKF
jgi:hypothetical protein